MIINISWKNVWRNKIRSLVVIIAIAIGLFGGIFSAALMEGMSEQRLEAAVNNELAHIQLHNPLFLNNNETCYTINNTTEVLQKIGAMEGVKAVAARKEFQAMIQTAYNQTGIILQAVDIEQELKLSKLSQRLIDSTGSYLDNNEDNRIYIGEKLAKKLKLVRYSITDSILNIFRNENYPEEVLQKLETLKETTYNTEDLFRDAIVTTLGEESGERYKYQISEKCKTYKLRTKIIVRITDKEGFLVDAAFRIAGIYKTNNTAFDEMYAFVKNSDIETITGFSPEESHEIAILLNDIKMTENIKSQIQNLFPEIAVEEWKELSPELKMLDDYMGFINYVFIIIILLALGFGIINTMLMVVLERTKELGMLMAIGMNKLKVFLMIMTETVLLSLSGGVLGMIISYVVIRFFAKYGLSLGSGNTEIFESIGYEAIMYPKIELSFYLAVTFLVIATGIVSAIYPAFKALKLKPVEAIRID